MSESTYYQAGDTVTRAVVSAYAADQVGQAPDGRAFIVRDDAGISAGTTGRLSTTGNVTLTKATGFVALAGLTAYWDASANQVTYKDLGDADFPVGVFLDDALVGATTCQVVLNERRRPKIDLLNDPAESPNLTGTLALGTTAAPGFLSPQRVGGSVRFVLSATNEAQVNDLLSRCGFKATGAAAIVRILFNVINDGGSGTQDVSLGIASGSHASDMDSVAQALLFHLDGNTTTINAESRDGTTTVARVSTATTYTESGTLANRKELWIDMRNPADVQLYVDGVNVLPSSVFNVAAAASEWKPVVHVEKTATTDVYTLEVHAFEVYTADERDAA